MSRSILTALKIAGIISILIGALLCILAVTGLLPEPVLKRAAVRIFMIILIATGAVIGISAIASGMGGGEQK